MENTVKFLTIEQFKTKIGASEVQVLKNKKTGKLFMATDTGESFKVEQEIDPKKDMKVLVPEEGGIAEACLVNVANSAEVQFTL